MDTQIKYKVYLAVASSVPWIPHVELEHVSVYRVNERLTVSCDINCNFDMTIKLYLWKIYWSLSGLSPAAVHTP
jgi:hypothetical protein